MAVNGNDYVPLISAADIAEVPAGTLRQWIESGKLPATTSERGRLVRLADVWRLVAAETPRRVEAVLEETPRVMPHPAPVPARRRHRAVARGVAPFVAKLDELYRAQIAAKDGEIAAKDDLIAELRRRAERAEQQATALEQKLVEVQASPVPAPEAQMPVVAVPDTAPAPGRLARLWPWSRRR